MSVDRIVDLYNKRPAQDVYVQSEPLFTKVSLAELMRLSLNLVHGAEVGSVDFHLWGQFDQPPTSGLLSNFTVARALLGLYIPALGYHGREVGVTAWSPANNAGTVQDFFGFFVRRLREEGPRITKGSALCEYRERVDNWVRNQPH